MKKKTVIVLVVIIMMFYALSMAAIVQITNSAVGNFVTEHFSVAEHFSDHPTVVIRNDERYHILPEKRLDKAIVIMDQDGEKYYVISEEKLRLLGPKLLTGGE